MTPEPVYSYFCRPLYLSIGSAESLFGKSELEELLKLTQAAAA